MENENGQQPDQPQPFIPDGQYAAQALREQITEERAEHRTKLDSAVERATYLRATLLQLQDEAAREIARRDAIIESQTRTIQQLREGAQDGAGGNEAPSEGQDTEGTVDDSDTVSWTRPSAPADTQQVGGTPEDVTLDSALIERDGGRLEPIPGALDGLEPDPALVPSGVSANGTRPDGTLKPDPLDQI